MSDIIGKKKPRPFAGKSTKAIIKHYQDMSAAEIDAELQHFGIDPRPTIEAVTKLVHDKLEELGVRGGLHQKKKLAAFSMHGNDLLPILSRRCALATLREY